MILRRGLVCALFVSASAHASLSECGEWSVQGLWRFNAKAQRAELITDEGTHLQKVFWIEGVSANGAKALEDKNVAAGVHIQQPCRKICPAKLVGHPKVLSPLKKPASLAFPRPIPTKKMACASKEWFVPPSLLTVSDFSNMKWSPEEQKQIQTCSKAVAAQAIQAKLYCQCVIKNMGIRHRSNEIANSIDEIQKGCQKLAK